MQIMIKEIGRSILGRTPYAILAYKTITSYWKTIRIDKGDTITFDTNIEQTGDIKDVIFLNIDVTLIDLAGDSVLLRIDKEDTSMHKAFDKGDTISLKPVTKWEYAQKD